LRISTGFPNREVAQVLNLQEKDTVWEIVRLRRVRNSPSILEQAILPLTLVPVLDHQELSQGGSLYRFLREHYALIDDRTEQYFEVVRPSLMEQQELHLRRNEQIVRIRGVSLTSDGTAFDCWCQSYRAADFVFYTTSNRTGEILTLKDDIEWSIQNRKMKYKKNRRA
jgi:GntR family transcriptional regulator